MDLLDEAIRFATAAHSGMYRKKSKIPYILHPMETAAIAGTMTDDKEVLAAAMLHDTVEDAGVLPEEIREKFGERVAFLVSCETENKREGVPRSESWLVRKEETMATLKNTDDRGVRILVLSDKLSNMRSFCRRYEKYGDALWQEFNQKDKSKQRWYYETIADLLSGDLRDTEAWKEYRRLIDRVFGKEGEQNG